MTDYGRELARAALDIQAVKFNPAQPFRWASGYHMPIYNDNRMLLGTAAHRKLCAEAFAKIISSRQIPFDVVAGVATAGIPHSTTLADHLQKPLVYIRSASKDHGMKNRIEGPLPTGARVLVIEDVVSTGGSSVEAVQAVRSAGGIVDWCLCIFSYDFEPARKVFSEANCHVEAILTYETLLAEAAGSGYLSPAAVEDLRLWQQDPFGWGAARGFPRAT